MKILITGANGFIGQALTSRLTEHFHLADLGEITHLALLDLDHAQVISDPRVIQIRGCISDPSVLDQALHAAPDIVFHLAAVASGLAEQDFELGMRVNVHGTLQLLKRLAQAHRPARVIYTSSIGVYGTPLPDLITDATPVAPTLSYGAQKRAMELILSDYSRRGLVQGLALRLPGIVVRPGAANGAWSLFTSDLISALSHNTAVTLPVSSDATVWLMSLPRCIDNLVWATRASLPPEAGNVAYNLPCQHITIQQIIQYFDILTQGQASKLVHYQPRPDIQAQFGSYPPLTTADALSLGFLPDTSLAELVQRSMSVSSRITHHTETS